MRRLSWMFAVLALSCLPAVTAAQQNVILFIGDGMGPGQVRAAACYNGGPLSFELLPYSGWVTTHSADAAITDSAAAATAMATGVKVNNGVISMALPGDSSELPTALELLHAQGKATGLVTTTYMTHATPAAFGAHEPSRTNDAAIAADYLTQTGPNLLLGGGENGLSVSAAQAAGYTVVTDLAGLESLDASTETHLSGQFGSTHLPYEFDGLGSLPHLTDMTAFAIEMLSKKTGGFFLMVEGGRIDHAAHANDLERTVQETLEFSAAVQVALDWAAGRDDSLILVTADHETGGLTVLADNGAGNYPTVSWATGSHTAADVPIYASGVGAWRVQGLLDNTDVFTLSTQAVPEPATMSLLILGGLGIGFRHRKT